MDNTKTEEDFEKTDNIFKFESDSDDNQENKNSKLNEEENYSNQNKNSPSPANNKKHKELVLLETLVETLLNSKTKKEYDPIFVTDMAFYLKNKDRYSNFEKRAKNEKTLYGWFILDESDDEILFEERVNRLKEKGLEKIGQEIMVSPPDDDNIDFYSIIICEFILGKNFGINQEKELSEKDLEQYLKKDYDTIYRVNSNIHTQNPSKRYYILKKENIELLFLVKLKSI